MKSLMYPISCARLLEAEGIGEGGKKEQKNECCEGSHDFPWGKLSFGIEGILKICPSIY
jgi:hypothetical protein